MVMSDVILCRRTWCNVCMAFVDCRHDAVVRGVSQEVLMPKGGKVDRAVQAVEATGKSKGSAIAILKSKGVIHQAGKHLAAGKGGRKR